MDILTKQTAHSCLTWFMAASPEGQRVLGSTEECLKRVPGFYPAAVGYNVAHSKSSNETGLLCIYHAFFYHAVSCILQPVTGVSWER